MMTIKITSPDELLKYPLVGIYVTIICSVNCIEKVILWVLQIMVKFKKVNIALWNVFSDQRA